MTARQVRRTLMARSLPQPLSIRTPLEKREQQRQSRRKTLFIQQTNGCLFDSPNGGRKRAAINLKMSVQVRGIFRGEFRNFTFEKEFFSQILEVEAGHRQKVICEWCWTRREPPTDSPRWETEIKMHSIRLQNTQRYRPRKFRLTGINTHVESTGKHWRPTLIVQSWYLSLFLHKRDRWRGRLRVGAD